MTFSPQRTRLSLSHLRASTDSIHLLNSPRNVSQRRPSVASSIMSVTAIDSEHVHSGTSFPWILPIAKICRQRSLCPRNVPQEDFRDVCNADSWYDFFASILTNSLVDMGPKIQNFHFSSPRDNKLPTEEPDIRKWRPQGVLLSTFDEHTQAINDMKLSPDHLFFVTASDDGTCRVWDCERLEKNPVNRSRLAINTQGGKIKCIAFCEKSRTIISGSDNGTINLTRYFSLLRCCCFITRIESTFLTSEVL